VLGSKRAPAATNTGIVAAASAATRIVRVRRPPTTEAMAAITTTRPAWAAPDTTRSGHRWSPISAVIPRTSSGASGGWST
jgi:hypothetical protein